MAISKIKYPRIDFTGFVNGDSNNQLAIDSSGKLKVGLSAGTGVTLSNAGVIGLDLIDSTSSSATDQAPTANAVKTTYDVATSTEVSSFYNSDPTCTITISPTTARRFIIDQGASCTYTLSPSQAGLTWVMKIDKNEGDTIDFDSNVTLDKTIDANWWTCTIVFIAWNTSAIRGFVIAGE